MNSSKPSHRVGATRKPPETIARRVLDACSDCDTCRFQMDEGCLFFPELYRLFDQEKESGRPTANADLRRLIELCTLCGLCPCRHIRADIVRAKTEYVRREGMPLSIRLLADIQRVGRWCGLFPSLVNAALAFTPASRAAKKISRIHPYRRLPAIPKENFFSWARKQGLSGAQDSSPKVAYFAGCTAGYFFPQVARAAVAVLRHNGISVLVPPQQCCGMPTLLEGDDGTTIRRARFNLDRLVESVKAEYEVICACPTCGFLLKILLKERAYYSEAYQRSVNAGADEMMVPDPRHSNRGYASLKKSVYGKILRDDGYFAPLDPLKRIALANSTLDLGEYLARLCAAGQLDTRFRPVTGRMAYFAPCHQREQQVGTPYEALLALVPGLSVQRVGGSMDCCGMGGSMGFKESFYVKSMDLGLPLMREIQAITPEAIITDCLSCRLQFEHLLPYRVFHPLEVLDRAYESGPGWTS